MAARIRSRDSRIAVSGKPTIKTGRRRIGFAFDRLQIHFDVNQKSVNAVNGGGLHEEKHNFHLTRKRYVNLSA
jgi:hypothetical protein